MGWASESAAEIRLILTGFRSGVAEIAATSAAVGALGDEMTIYGDKAEEATAKSKGFFEMQGAFTARRFAYMGTLALGAITAETLKLGYTFNSTMQQATVALLPVMHNIGGVRAELETLFNIAKYSPFQFKDLTTAFRSMYLSMSPLGISAKTVTTTIQSMVDALAATGRGTPAALNRVSVALQHMAYQGRLTGYTVNQLARDGIPIFAALQKEMGISGQQLHSIATLGIPAQQVLAAINKYIETTPGFMNAAYRQAQTLHGQLTTIKDDIAQTVGALTLGSFNQTTTGLLPSITHMFDGISAIIVKQKGKISLDQVFGQMDKAWPWIKPLTDLIKQLVTVFQIMWNVLKGGVIPTIIILATVIDQLMPVLSAVLWVIKELSKFSWALIPILAALAAEFLILKAIELGQMAVTGALYAYYYLLGFGIRQVMNYQKLATLTTKALTRAQELWQVATTGSIRGVGGMFRSLSGFEKVVRSLGIAIRTTLIPALLDLIGVETIADILNPLMWVALIVAAVAALALLYWKWKWFHDLVNETFNFIWQHWKLMVALFSILFPIFAILLLSARLLYDHWGQLKKLLELIWQSVLKPFYQWLTGIWHSLVKSVTDTWNDMLKIIMSIVDWLKSVYDWIKKIIDKVLDLANAWKKVPGAAWAVGVFHTITHAVGSAASAVWNQPGVGIPANASGGALPTSAQSLGATPNLSNILHVHVHLDGKELASNSAKHRQRVRARATAHG